MILLGLILIWAGCVILTTGEPARHRDEIEEDTGMWDWEYVQAQVKRDRVVAPLSALARKASLDPTTLLRSVVDGSL